jgi:hypothetical protein
MTIGLLPDDVPGGPPDNVPDAPLDDPLDDVESGIHCARTPWIRGFMAFHPVQRAGTVMLMVPTSSGGFRGFGCGRSRQLGGR